MDTREQDHKEDPAWDQHLGLECLAKGGSFSRHFRPSTYCPSWAQDKRVAGSEGFPKQGRFLPGQSTWWGVQAGPDQSRGKEADTRVEAESSSSRTLRGEGVEEAQWGLWRSTKILGDQHRYFKLLFLGQEARGRIALKLNDT